MTSILTASLLILFICFFSFLLPILVFLRETHCVWALKPMLSVPQVSSASTPSDNPYQAPIVAQTELLPTSKGQKRCIELTEMGYYYLGNFRHAKEGIYKLRYDAWLSPDRLIVGIVASGNLLVPVCNLGLLSFHRTKNAEPGALMQCIESMTDVKSYHPRSKKLKDAMLFRSATARTADRLHRQRLQAIQPVPFPDDPLKFLREYSEQICNDLFARNQIRFVDEARNLWRPRFAMAMWMYFKTNAFQLSRLVFSDYLRLRIHNWFRSSKTS